MTAASGAPSAGLLRPLCVVVAALSALLFAAYLYYVLRGKPGLNDFFIFWSAARMSARTPLAAVYDPAQFQAFKLAYTSGHLAQFPFLYPPSAMLLFRPFAALPLGAALACWNLLSLAVFLAAVRRVLGTSWVPIALIAPITVISLLFGQTGLLLGGVAALGFGLRREQPGLAGALLGLLTLKPQLALLPLLALLICGPRRAAIAAAASAAALAGISAACFGLEPWHAWLDSLGGFSTGLSESAAHQQYGVTAYFTLLGLGLERRAALAAQALLSVVILKTVCDSLRRGDQPTGTAAALTGMFLFAPYAVVYDLPAVAVVCLILFSTGLRGGFGKGELFAVIAMWFAPFLVMFTPAPLHAVVFALLALLMLLIRARVQGRAAAPSS